jgi:ABC-type Na+ efflux pump permease subunit
MSKIFHLAWTDIRTEFSERSTLVFFLILPIVFTAILGNAMSGTAPDPGADNRLIVLLVDEDGSSLAAEFTTLLSSSQVVRPVLLERAAAEERLVEEGLPGLLIIPAGFGAALLAGKSWCWPCRRPSPTTGQSPCSRPWPPPPGR